MPRGVFPANGNAGPRPPRPNEVRARDSAVDRMGGAVAEVADKFKQDPKVSFHGAADFSKAIQTAITGKAEENRHRDILKKHDGVKKAVDGAADVLKVIADGVKGLKLGMER